MEAEKPDRRVLKLEKGADKRPTLPCTREGTGYDLNE
jgi:hypothetical protein